MIPESVVQNRIAALREEIGKGEARLAELEAETVEVRATMLRITGAIQALTELVENAEPQ